MLNCILENNESLIEKLKANKFIFIMNKEKRNFIHKHKI